MVRNARVDMNMIVKIELTGEMNTERPPRLIMPRMNMRTERPSEAKINALSFLARTETRPGPAWKCLSIMIFVEDGCAACEDIERVTGGEII